MGPFQRRWQLDHGIERAGIERPSGALLIVFAGEWGQRGDVGLLINGGNSTTVSSALASASQRGTLLREALQLVKSAEGSVVTWGNSGGDSATVSYRWHRTSQRWRVGCSAKRVEQRGGVGLLNKRGYSATVSTALASDVQRCTLMQSVRSGEEWGQRGDVGLLGLGWRLDHGIERAGIGRRSGVLYSGGCSGEEWGQRGDVGRLSYGADSTTVSNELISSVTNVYSTQKAFVAIRIGYVCARSHDPRLYRVGAW